MGNAADYRQRLTYLIEAMHRSLIWWLSAQWRERTPVLANDQSPAAELRDEMRSLARRWQSRFDQTAPRLARYFTRRAADRVEGRLAKILADGGFSVQFKLTPAVRDALAATTGENVGLIKSIAAEHLGAVEGLVMRSVTAGRDLATLTRELEQRYDLTRRRAALIARDQNNKATATISRVRMLDAGIARAIWMHSHAGKTPRPAHVRMDGQPYDVQKGMWDSDERKWVHPGELINCRCTSRPIVPGF